LIRIIISLSG